MSGVLNVLYICMVKQTHTMKAGQRYTNGVDTFKITAVSKQGIKVTTERESDGAVMVFDWEGARGFVYRFDHKLPIGVLIND